MLHSGGAYGGHYSAYILDLSDSAEKDSWYHFNDTFVTPISITELVKAFGNLSISASQPGAYMLMYRLIDQ
jgi:ubiquitin C-terminal hydrolase